MVEWVALRPILDILDKKKIYDGGGMRWDLWWGQTAARKQLSMTLEEIFSSTRERCWKSGRRGEGKRGEGGR